MIAQIFVEGIADRKFIEDYLAHLNLMNIEVVDIKGKDSVINTRPLFEINFSKGIKNILILDADGDFAKRKSEIEAISFFSEYKIELFLFPNNSSNGDFERLLENIINPQNAHIFDCWKSYQDCLRAFPQSNELTLPNDKAKIYAYLEALSPKESDTLKESKRNYLIKDHWNLDSEYLNPLKEFLS